MVKACFSLLLARIRQEMPYRLLRNNIETGPFTKAQLIDKGLYPNDLIWVEGESDSWKYPTEMEALKGFVKELSADRLIRKPVKSKPVIDLPIRATVNQKEALEQPGYNQASIDELKKQYQERLMNGSATKKKSKKKNSVLTPVLLSLPVLILGVIIGVNWRHQSQPTTLASPTLEKASTIFDTQRTENLDNTAVLTDSSLVSKPTQPKKDSTVTIIEAPVQLTPAVKQKKEGFKRSIEDVVSVKANYKKTGNGIKNIKLNVSNLSYLNLDLVVLELYYVGAYQKILEKETIYLKNVNSKGKQSVDAPNGGKHTENIRYKVKLVTAKDANLHLVSR